MHPVARYLEWFALQPPVYQEIMASWILLTTPSGIFPSSGAVVRDPVEAFVAHVKNHDEPYGAGAGLAVLLAALTDFTIDYMRSLTAESVSDETLLRKSREAEAQGQFDEASHLARAAARAPLWSRHWERVADSWDQLRTGELSQVAIGEWLFRNISQRWRSG
jgi:hypothetical protein